MTRFIPMRDALCTLCQEQWDGKCNPAECKYNIKFKKLLVEMVNDG
jgi:hypothetical protein